MTTFQDTLLEIADRTPLFAVLDGAQFSNLPIELLQAEFVARSLYLDRGENDPDQVITAPHLVWLDERRERPDGRGTAETIAALLAFLEGRPAAVFWNCAAGGEALYRHLRGINMVMYPKEALDDWEEPDPNAEAVAAGLPPDPDAADAEPDPYTLVLFRHADANVIAQVVPGMTGEETARFFGPAERILCLPNPEWLQGEAFFDLPRDPQLPGPAPGPLHLSSQTLDAVEETQIAVSQVRIKDYLAEAAPEYLEVLPEGELDQVVQEAQDVGEALGIQSEYGHGLWALLALITGGEVLRNSQVHHHIQNSDAPDDALDAIMAELGEASDAEWEALL